MTPGFQTLSLRLIAFLKEQVRCGSLTERGLAHLVGISQPHVHNVLKGARSMTPATADRIMAKLNLSFRDLQWEQEPARHADAPLLAGLIGPGHPFPKESHTRLPFSAEFLSRWASPAVARLADDPDLPSPFRPGDLVMIERTPIAQREKFARDAWIVVAIDGGSAIRRLANRRDDARILGKVVWFSRDVSR